LNSLVKNIFTAIIALTLLISTTGFQVYKHICVSHNFSEVSLVETPTCEKDHQIVEETDDCCNTELEKTVEPGCCESESIDYSNSVSITSQEIECCVSTIEGSQIQDNLFPPAEKKNLTLELFTALVHSLEIEIQQTEQNLVLQNNNLPPPIFGKTLLQTIHQLKIDTPIC
jgi:hypothetical protein